MKEVYQRPVVYHNLEGRLAYSYLDDNLTPDQISEIMQKVNPSATSYLIDERENEPESKIYFSAWYYSDDPEPHIAIDIAKGISIQKNRIRDIRGAKFAEADVMFQRALEDNDEVKKAEATSIKIALRNAPDMTDSYPEILEMDPKDIDGVSNALKAIHDESLLGSTTQIDFLFYTP